jgi:hypothetical protein
VDIAGCWSLEVRDLLLRLEHRHESSTPLSTANGWFEKDEFHAAGELESPF